MKITPARRQNQIKMNDKAVQAIVRKYIVNMQMRHASYSDGEKDTTLEKERK